jgi:hypothetical protein
MRQLPEGQADLAKAAAMQPKGPVGLTTLCWGQAEFGDLTAAKASCAAAQAAAAMPDLQLQVLLADVSGYLDLQSKNDAAAIAAFDAVLRIDPAQAGALYGRGLAEQGNGAADIAAAKRLDPEIAAQFGK